VIKKVVSSKYIWGKKSPAKNAISTLKKLEVALHQERTTAEYDHSRQTIQHIPVSTFGLLISFNGENQAFKEVLCKYIYK